MNKRTIILVLIIGFIVLLTGCAPAPQPPPTPPTPPTPTTCTVIVTSEDATVWGQAVYMDGNPMPNTLLTPWSSVEIHNVTVGVRHTFAIIQGGTFSHNEYLTPVPGTNYINFYWF